jgi:hypothetical protein
MIISFLMRKRERYPLFVPLNDPLFVPLNDPLFVKCYCVPAPAFLTVSEHLRPETVMKRSGKFMLYMVGDVCKNHVHALKTRKIRITVSFLIILYKL